MFDTILTNPGAVVGLLFVIAVTIVVVYMVVGSGSSACPTELHRRTDGTLELRPTGQTFHDMNAYAKTPIYKVDDYELSRIVGNERDGHMIMPRENYNMILGERTFDWADRPMSSDERRGKYQGLREGFTAAGELKSEAVARYRERHSTSADNDLECKMSREAREVGTMVARAYESDPNWEPVVTKVGANHWEVNELKPRRRNGEIEETEMVDRVVDTTNDAVDVQFRYREKPVVEDAIDPYFGGIGSAGTGNLPFDSDRYSARQADPNHNMASYDPSHSARQADPNHNMASYDPSHSARQADPFAGPVPGMQRMFGPTFDHKKWF